MEAAYPALLFQQQLRAFVQKLFPMLRDSVQRQLAPLLAKCIHVPPKGPEGSLRGVSPLDQAPTPHTTTSEDSWSSLLAVLDALLATLKDNHTPQPLVQALFRQLFSFVNVQLFNQLLLCCDACTYSNGERVRAGLAQVHVCV